MRQMLLIQYLKREIKKDLMHKGKNMGQIGPFIIFDEQIRIKFP